jgi:indolepyruvate ferredoxin oxidoreductase alpha subunit
MKHRFFKGGELLLDQRMNAHPSSARDLFRAPPHTRKILTGNDAYTRGLMEAGVQYFATYPGTPTSEIGDLWMEHAQAHTDVHFDLAVNETVAFEGAVGASWSGVRAAVAFKHLGMNLIADPLHTVMYAGIDGERRAGFVIICGGDPDCTSSTNAEDIRLFTLHTKIPLLEPSTVQECKEFVPLAFQLSELWQVPVLIYSPSQLNHAYGIVTMGEITPWKEKTNLGFRKNPDRYLNAIFWARTNQVRLNTLIQRLAMDPCDTSDSRPLYEQKGEKALKISCEEQSGKKFLSKIAFLASGFSWAAAEEVCLRVGQDVPRLRLHLTYPMNVSVIQHFVNEFKPEYLFVLEEGESFLELQVKNILYDLGLSIPVIGKPQLPFEGSLTADLIITRLGESFDVRGKKIRITEFSKYIHKQDSMIVEIQKSLPIREPTFCPGCSHRNVFYALKLAAAQFQTISGKEPIYGGDIGCYSMSMSAPFETMDWMICMGAGLGISNGVARIINPDRQHVIALVGDSTLFHSGIQSLMNLAKDNISVTVLILDNYFCAMTGDQLSPSTPGALNSLMKHPISIPGIIQACGDLKIHRLDGYHIKSMISVMKTAFSEPGLKILLVEAECALHKRSRVFVPLIPENSDQTLTHIYITEDCVQCNECYERLGCTAIENIDGKYQIDSSRCMREHCGSCIEICPNHAIRKTVINPHKPKKTKPEGFSND